MRKGLVVTLLLCLIFVFYGCVSGETRSTYDGHGEIKSKGNFEIYIPDDWYVSTQNLAGISDDNSLLFSRSEDNYRQGVFLLIQIVSSEDDCNNFPPFSSSNDIEPFSTGNIQWTGKERLIYTQSEDKFVRVTCSGFSWESSTIIKILQSIKILS